MQGAIINMAYGGWTRYGDGAGNTTEENALIQMH